MLKKPQKTIPAIALVIALSLGGSTEARAWSQTKGVSLSLRFTGSTANCNYRVTGLRGTKKITATMRLKDVTGGEIRMVKRWGDLKEDGAVLSGSRRIKVSKRHTYKLVLSAKVYNAQNDAERVTDSMKLRCS